MAHTLFVVHGSHPCDAVERAFQLKGIPYRVRELPPPFHAAILRPLFGGRTVPALKLDSGEKLQGSTAILRRLEELQPEPSLALDDPAVAEAERWGADVWQPIARRLLWPGLQRTAPAMASYQQGSRLPAFPLPVLRVIAPGAGWVERRMNGAADAAIRADLQALDVHLDRIDAWIADGTLRGAGAPDRRGPPDRRDDAPAADHRRRAAAHRRPPGRRPRARAVRVPLGRAAGGRAVTLAVGLGATTPPNP